MSIKISIITAVYNNCSTVSHAIESVLSQDYPNIEYIIIDGKSTDGTVDIIRKFEGKISKWVSEPDKGIYDAMNKGLELATGDVIGLLNSDDFYENTSVISDVASIFHAKNTDALYGDLLYVDAKDITKIVRYWKAKPYVVNTFLRGWMPPHPTFFVKKEIYQKYGKFNTSFKSAADYEFMLRVIHKHKIKLAYLPQILVRMRTGGVSNLSLKNRLMANKEDYLAWQLNELKPRFYTMWLKPFRKLYQYFARPKF
ncbi:MAG: glycosyltransferase family 2 protein [Bacteroidota bacterium]